MQLALPTARSAYRVTTFTSAALAALAAPVALAVLAFSVPALAGCDLLAKRLKEQGWRTVSSSDGYSEIRIPKAWNRASIDEMASVQAIHPSTISGLMVFTESKEDFAAYSLQGYASMILDTMAKDKIFVRKEAGPTKLKVGPYRALGYEIITTARGFQYRRMHCFVEGPHHVHHVMLWTTVEAWPQRKPVFERILASFRERQGQATPPDPPSGRVALRQVKEANGASAMEVPISWKAMPELNEQASISLGDLARSRFAIVISEQKEQMPEPETLDVYSQNALAMLTKGLTELEKTPPARLTINGNSARRQEIHGVMDGIRVSYLVIMLESPNHFHQVYMWSQKSDWNAVKPLFEQMAMSFRSKSSLSPPP